MRVGLNVNMNLVWYYRCTYMCLNETGMALDEPISTYLRVPLSFVPTTSVCPETVRMNTEVYSQACVIQRLTGNYEGLSLNCTIA